MERIFLLDIFPNERFFLFFHFSDTVRSSTDTPSPPAFLPIPTMTSAKPLTPVDEFLQRLVHEHGQLSRQLKLIGT